MKFFISGSCVSRDPFTPEILDEFEVVGYSARYSLARLCYPSVNMDIDPKSFEEKVPKAFVRKLLTNEFENNLIERLETNIFDYLVLDFVSERFGLVMFKNSSYVTNSYDMRNAKLAVLRDAPKVDSSSQEFLDNFKKGLELVAKTVGKEKIIINNVFWTSKLNDGNTVSTPEVIEKRNSFVSVLYQIAKDIGIPETNFVNYPLDIFVADSNHKWAVSPFHYTQDVYDYFIDYLRSLVNQE